MGGRGLLQCTRHFSRHNEQKKEHSGCSRGQGLRTGRRVEHSGCSRGQGLRTGRRVEHSGCSRGQGLRTGRRVVLLDLVSREPPSPALAGRVCRLSLGLKGRRHTWQVWPAAEMGGRPRGR